MNPELGLKCRALLLYIWPCNWLSATISHFHSTVLKASYLGLIRLQLKWASHKMGVAQLPRKKAPKTKVICPRINSLGPKNLNFPAIAMSAGKKATELHTAGKRVNCSLYLHLQAKTALKIKIQFPNRESDCVK